MGNGDGITFTVDTTRLNAALDYASKFSARSGRKILMATAFYVAVKAQKMTPHVETSRIDREMGIEVRPGRTKAGRVSKSKKNVVLHGARRITFGAGHARAGESMPLAAAIIQASVWPGMTLVELKRYNKLTNNRWLRSRSPYAGVPRPMGRMLMRAAVSRMLKSRRSSTHFLQVGWGVVCKKLRALHFSGEDMVGGGWTTLSATNMDLGAATYGEGGWKSWVRIENRIGMQPGKKGDNSASYNRALHKYGGPALQAAVNEQAGEMFVRYWKKEFAKTRAGFNRLAGVR